MLVKTYRKTGEDRQIAGQKPYSHHNIKQTLISIIVVFLLLAAPLAGFHPALSVVYAEAKLQTESELRAGETFPLTVDPGDQTLFLKLPAGLTLAENAANLAEDGSLVISNRLTLLVKANPGSYTLQLKDSASQAAGEPLRFTVSAATDSNVDKTADAANNSEPAVDESGAQGQGNSQEDGSSEAAAGDDNTAALPGDEAGQAPDGEGAQLPAAGSGLASGNTSETPTGDSEAASASSPEGKDDASGSVAAAAGAAGSAAASGTAAAAGSAAASGTPGTPGTTTPTSSGITPLADDQIQSVTVISASTSQIRLGVTISEDYLSGGSIELPLNYTPTVSSHPYFTYGTNGSNGVGQSSNPTPPFFSAINLISSDQTIVRDYDLSSKPGYLVINLKDKSDSGFSSGYATIVLNLTLNAEWERLIPENTVLWTVAPQAYVDGLPSGTANTQTISGGWPATLSFSMYGSTDPNLNLYYLGGALAPSLHYSPYQLEPDRPSDPNYPINTWIEIPAGSTLGTPSSSQFSLDSAGSSSEFDRYQATTSTPILSVVFTPAASIAVDETFQVRAGISGFRFANGPAEGAMQAVPITFTKISPDSSNPQWGLSMSSSASISYCNLANGSVSGSFNFGTRGLTYSSTTGAILNLGWDVITGVSGVVYQRGSGSEKVNINEMHLQFLRESLTTNWCYYQVDYQIIDTRGGSRTQIDPLGVYQPSSATWYEDVQLTLPTLNAYEYIDQIIITPFGAVGNARGVLTGSNGVLASGQITSPNTALAWDNGLWPDGTAVPEFSMAQLGFVMHYDDNPNKPGGYLPSGGIPSNFEKGIATVYYSDAPFVTARILTSSNDACQIGQTLDCTIEANCGSDCAIDALWIEPRIIISVPKGLNLVSGSGLSGQSSTGENLVVQPQLVSSDSDWNYYSFQVVGTNLGRGQSLTIPLSFLVTDTVQGGNYQPTVVLTARNADDFIQNSFKYNNLNTVYNMNGSPANYGLGSNDRYYVNGTAASYDLVS
ncbi:MAG: hypothetical protein LBG68_01755, partial [Coriobacteriales bacterium]|nr:hypothetical protein [Coriobacteriales bacterium]